MSATDANGLFYRHIWPLRSAVLRAATFLCRDTHEAEDLAQETMLKAFRAIGQFDVGTSAQAWVMTILRNTRIDRLRVRKDAPVSIEGSDIDLPDTHTAEEPHSDADLRDMVKLIESFSDQGMIGALRELPEELGMTLILADVEQLDYTQAAEILGVPVGTVKSRVHRGRGMLKALLTKRAKGARHE